MIIGCFRGCFSFNAQTKFEKARLQATYSGDYEPPSEDDVQQVLQTLSGRDPETRPDVAFSLLQSKMQYSESKNIWNYLVKNLVLLDRCAEDRSFVSDIATLHILHVENYRDPDPKNNIIRIDGFIQRYFQYIRMKSRLYAKKESSYNIPKNQKRTYFQGLNAASLFSELNEAVALFTFVIELARTNTDPLNRVSKRGYLEYNINQYVFHLILYTTLNLYITMFTIITVFLEKLQAFSIDESQKIKYYYMQFLKNSELFSQFIDDHRFIKGYEEIKITEFYQPNRNAMQTINEWIALIESQKNQTDSNAINIKLDENAKLIEPIKIFRVNRYTFKTDNKVNFLGEEENFIEIKQVSSELKQVLYSSQDNENDGNIYNSNNLEKLDNQQKYLRSQEINLYGLGESTWLSDSDMNSGNLKSSKQQFCFLDSTKLGFDKQYFMDFSNEYSENSSSKTGKYATRQQKIGKIVLERNTILEDYFLKSFQNTVSFMINDKGNFNGGSESAFKKIPQFNPELFKQFVNEYSVEQQTLFVYDEMHGTVYQDNDITNSRENDKNKQDLEEQQQQQYSEKNQVNYLNNDQEMKVKDYQYANNVPDKETARNPAERDIADNSNDNQSNVQFVTKLVNSQTINTMLGDKLVQSEFYNEDETVNNNGVLYSQNEWQSQNGRNQGDQQGQRGQQENQEIQGEYNIVNGNEVRNKEAEQRLLQELNNGQQYQQEDYLNAYGNNGDGKEKADMLIGGDSGKQEEEYNLVTSEDYQPKIEEEQQQQYQDQTTEEQEATEFRFD